MSPCYFCFLSTLTLTKEGKALGCGSGILFSGAVRESRLVQDLSLQIKEEHATGELEGLKGQNPKYPKYIY